MIVSKKQKVFFSKKIELGEVEVVKKKKPVLLILTAFVCLFSILIFIFSILNSKKNSEDEVNAQYYYSDQIIIKVNEKRIENGLDPLLVNEKLMISAQNKADHMAKNNYFSHICPLDDKKWSDFIKEVSYDYLEAGENLANGYTSLGEMVQAWMDSPTHKENILGKGYYETGVGYAKGKLSGRDTIFVVQVFGRTTEKRDDTLKLYTLDKSAEVEVPETDSLLDLVEKSKK